jgi:RimJ/RimL family protein N-acetyltransferase
VPSPYTEADALEWIAFSELEQSRGRPIDWLAVDAAGEVLASVGLQFIDRERGTAEVGYWVAAGARGRGVAARAVRLVSDWAVAELGLREIQITAHEDNAASQAVARRAGYAQARVLPEPPGEGLRAGRYVLFTWQPSNCAA